MIFEEKLKINEDQPIMDLDEEKPKPKRKSKSKNKKWKDTPPLPPNPFLTENEQPSRSEVDWDQLPFPDALKSTPKISMME